MFNSDIVGEVTKVHRIISNWFMSVNTVRKPQYGVNCKDLPVSRKSESPNAQRSRCENSFLNCNIQI